MPETLKSGFQFAEQWCDAQSIFYLLSGGFILKRKWFEYFDYASAALRLHFGCACFGCRSAQRSAARLLRLSLASAVACFGCRLLRLSLSTAQHSAAQRSTAQHSALSTRHKGKTFKPLVKGGLRGQSPLKLLTAEYIIAVWFPKKLPI